jgi:hypothetical protein
VPKNTSNWFTIFNANNRQSDCPLFLFQTFENVQLYLETILLQPHERANKKLSLTFATETEGD